MLKIYFSNYYLVVEIGLVILGSLALLLAIFFVIRKKYFFSNSEIELNISLGGIGNIKIKPNYVTKQIAHKCWTELITRKAGLLFEEEHDVVVEIYNSWYTLFAETRSLIKEIPANQINNPETQKLVKIMVDTLNKGLRPHLTEWQAKFRAWYQKEIEKNAELTPQEVQKKYPHYSKLIIDLKKVNIQIHSYAEELHKII